MWKLLTNMVIKTIIKFIEKGGGEKMKRNDLLLAGLSAGKGQEHSPVQVQKLFFLIDREIPQLVGGPHFNFNPYNYGPFDKTVYSALKDLSQAGLVKIIPAFNWSNYALTSAGQKTGEEIFKSLPVEAQNYIKRASEFVCNLTFTQLVSAIYKAYPEMRQNSVFQE